MDPTLADLHGESSRLMHVCNSLTAHARGTQVALERDGHVVGAVLISFHRLQGTYGVEVALDPDADVAIVRELCRSMVEALMTRGAGDIRVQVWDFQPLLKKILLDCGFQQLVERILVSCPLR